VALVDGLRGFNFDEEVCRLRLIKFEYWVLRVVPLDLAGKRLPGVQ
jgi:hypothetical protein